MQIVMTFILFGISTQILNHFQEVSSIFMKNYVLVNYCSH